MSKIMPKKVSAKTARAIEKLAQVTRELYQGKDYNITRLTTLKSLCQDPTAANHFVFYLAQQTQKKMAQKETPSHLAPEKWRRHKALVRESVAHIKSYLASPTAQAKDKLRNLLYKIKQLQNTYENQRWGPVRLIESTDTLVVEKAMQCILSPAQSAFWGYHVGREYAERYDIYHGTGLIPESAPLLADIVNFWYDYYNIKP
ncbi:MAG: hypothetical protein U1F76_15680 [Candidatus Competibacteraceae bacterium]